MGEDDFCRMISYLELLDNPFPLSTKQPLRAKLSDLSIGRQQPLSGEIKWHDPSPERERAVFGLI